MFFILKINFYIIKLLIKDRIWTMSPKKIACEEKTPKKSKKKHELQVLFECEDFNDINQDMIIISLQTIPENIKKTIIDNKGSWFDLEIKEWRGERNEINIEIKNYLGRYGIRLKYIELYAK